MAPPSPDNIPPSAPEALVATASGSTSIDLSWRAATDNVGVTGYEVFRDNGATAIGATTATSFNDTGLAPDSTHSYTVAAIDAAGNRSVYLTPPPQRPLPRRRLTPPLPVLRQPSTRPPMRSIFRGLRQLTMLVWLAIESSAMAAQRRSIR